MRFGKSLIYQLMAPFADFMDSGFRPTETNSIVLVVSPLNPLIGDQVTKLRECGLRACILKGDHVAGSRSFRSKVVLIETKGQFDRRREPVRSKSNRRRRRRTDLHI